MEINFRIARLGDYEELKGLGFKLRTLDRELMRNHDIAKDIHKRWLGIQEAFDQFFKEKGLVPEQAEFIYVVENGNVFLAPKQTKDHMVMVPMCGDAEEYE